MVRHFVVENLWILPQVFFRTALSPISSRNPWFERAHEPIGRRDFGVWERIARVKSVASSGTVLDRVRKYLKLKTWAVTNVLQVTLLVSSWDRWWILVG